MAKRALALKYRPSTFNDLCSQDAIKTILTEQISTKTFQHCYLFTGPAGCGKTTSARIFANMINEGKGNPIEVDAASNSGVENIRVIIEDAKKKSLDSEYKVYIIDECFPSNTLITMADGTQKKISDVNTSDYVLSMSSNQKVTNVIKNRVFTDRLCCVKINGRNIITTVDHLFFTENGWTKAKDLLEGDLVYGNENMYELWQRVSGKGRKELCSKILQSSMFSTVQRKELCSKKSNDNLQDMWQRVPSSSKQTITSNLFKGLQEQANIEVLYSDNEFRILSTYTETIIRKNVEQQSYEEPRNNSKDDRNKGTEWNTSSMESRERWKWKIYNSTNTLMAEFREWMDFGISNKDELQERGTSISYLLQSRPRISRNENCDRSGWQRTQVEKQFIKGCKENQVSTEYRVDSVEIYKRGNNDELFRSSFTNTELSGEYIDMYDLEVENESCYFANDILVHNCHMLSTSAWNAFLKLLEEPPKFTIFILCTTDPQKIISTILSRVQRYDFTKIPYDVIVERLKYICTEEKITATEDALSFISKLSSGGMRDAITRLDKCISLSDNVDIENVVKALGTVDYDTFFKLLEQCNLGLSSDIIETIEKVYNDGKDLKNFVKEFLKFMVDVCKYKLFGSFEYINIPNLKQYSDILQETDKSNCFKIMELFKEINSIIKYDTDVKYTIESIILSEAN